MENCVKQVIKVQNNISFINKLEKAKMMSNSRSVVFLCVGNSKIWFDAFGPYVGSLLQKMGVKNYVYGNNRYNILGNNIKNFVDLIYRFHINPYIIVVDSSVSNVSEFDIFVSEEKTVCGAYSESPYEVGDMKISCLVPSKAILNASKKDQMILQIKRICYFLKYVFID